MYHTARGPQRMTIQHRRFLFAGVLAAAVAGLVAWGIARKSDPPREPTQAEPVPVKPIPKAFPHPPATASRYLNTHSPARFVGTKTCAGCHPGEHSTYLETGHSRALAELDPAAGPPDGEFHHAASGRWYRVYRLQGKMRHREFLKTAGGEELTLADHAMRYVVGSGRHSLTYLIEDDGFLAESPATWYASKQTWKISPGYDAHLQPGFERGIDGGCLICHAGRIEDVPRRMHRARIHELAIGCENCHGPGSLHVARWQQDDPAALEPGVRDDTIVHPAGLNRELREAVCAQCHLRGEATVLVRGRTISDFRPGLPLTDYRVDYGLELPGTRMKVVGHVEQMRLSRCYTQSNMHSKKMTCTTCHNPHAKPPSSKRAAYYRSKCITCHDTGDCGVERAVRIKTSAVDNCVVCHMPQSPTDIPHLAFTHHRIGMHRGEDKRPPPADRIGKLIEMQKPANLTAIDRDRCLGLAYLELSESQVHPKPRIEYRRRAFDLLRSVHQRGLRDPQVDVSLAGLSAELKDYESARLFANRVLRSHAPPPAARLNALFVLGKLRLGTGRSGAAVEPVEELTRSRRDSRDWLMLSQAHGESGDAGKALTALQRAVEIAPHRAESHAALADLLKARGDLQSASRHRRIAEQLRKIAPRPPPR